MVAGWDAGPPPARSPEQAVLGALAIRGNPPLELDSMLRGTDHPALVALA